MLDVKGKIPYSIYILKKVASNQAGMAKACRHVKKLGSWKMQDRVIKK